MKIAVATDDFEHVSGHVGRCGGFIILDVENGEIKNREEVKNTFTHHTQNENGHGNGHHHNSMKRHDRLVEAFIDCDHLICQSAGWRLVEDLKAANIITIYTSVTDAVTAAIKLEQGELDTNEEGACHSH